MRYRAPRLKETRWPSGVSAFNQHDTMVVVVVAMVVVIVVVAMAFGREPQQHMPTLPHHQHHHGVAAFEHRNGVCIYV